MARRFLSVSVAFLVLATSIGPAHALFGAGDVVFDPTSFADLEKQVENGISMLRQAEQQYAVMMQQYQAVAHLPDRVISIGEQLATVPTLRNPLPQAGALSGIMNGTGLGPVAGLAGQFSAANRYYQPQGDDWTAEEMNRRTQGTSGIQALAMQALQAVQERAASLGEFLGEIGSSPDIQQSAAIQARLQLEQNFIAGQQVQAQQLAILQRAQETVDQQRAEEKARKDAEYLYNATAPIGGE